MISIITHPWLNNRVEVVFTQVKSGPAYCSVVDGTLIVNKEKFSDLTKRNHNTLVCWSRVDNDNPYWFLIKANTSYFRTTYNENHRLTPSSRFDIVRILTSTAVKDGGKGLVFSRDNNREEYKTKDFQLLRNKAKSLYSLLQSNLIINPLFGTIEFTRLGWRHITRESRLNTYKISSFEVMSILNHLLSKTPTKHYTFDNDYKFDNVNTYRISEYLLEYDNVICYDKERNSVKIYIKLLEFTCFMKNWRNIANSAAEVERRVIFKSIYYKNKRSS